MVRPPPTSTLFPTRRSSDLTTKAAMSWHSRGVFTPRIEGLASLAAANHQATARRCLASRRPWEGCRRRSEEHTSELQSRLHLVCRLLLEKKKIRSAEHYHSF